ncbi:signal peptidase I [Desulfovibrio sp. OttesenSCG-928-I05]|nr:signal peptidase I [Desulfovibrio sp. OttesenSCG-928-I05]
MSHRSMFWEYAEALLIAIVLALVIRAFVLQPFTIPSGSMLPTLQKGDYLFITRFDYGIKIPFTDKEIVHTGDPQHGDIIVFRYPKDESMDYIKRVVGVPGDVVEMRDKQLYRNGEKVTEAYIINTDPHSYPGRDNMSPRSIPEGYYFVMGDNRDGSADSREWGLVPRANIHGKAWFLYWSWDDWFTNVHWDRIGTMLR